MNADSDQVVETRAKLRFPLGTLFAPLLFLFGFLFDCLASGRPYFTLADWRYVYYYLNYPDFGFIKRGLVGTIVQLADFGDLDTWLPGVVVALGTVAVIIIIYIYSRLERSNVLKVLFILSPFTFMNYGYDAGRFDLLLNLVFVSVLILIHRRQYFVCGAIMFVAPLIHEVFMVAHIPVLLFFSVLLIDRRQRAKALAQIFLPAVLSFGIVTLFGKYEGDLREIAVLFDDEWFWEHYRYFMVLKRNIVDNLFYNYGFISGVGLDNTLIIVLPMGIYIPIIFQYYKNLPYKFLLLFACLSPLALAIIAADIGRWVSFSLFLIFFSFPFLACQAQYGAGKTGQNPTVPSASMRWVAVGAVLFALSLFLMGPAGHYLGWPLTRALAAHFLGFGLPLDGE
jgi:hypothetical protein